MARRAAGVKPDSHGVTPAEGLADGARSLCLCTTDRDALALRLQVAGAIVPRRRPGPGCIRSGTSPCDPSGTIRNPSVGAFRRDPFVKKSLIHRHKLKNLKIFSADRTRTPEASSIWNNSCVLARWISLPDNNGTASGRGMAREIMALQRLNQ